MTAETRASCRLLGALLFGDVDRADVLLLTWLCTAHRRQCAVEWMRAHDDDDRGAHVATAPRHRATGSAAAVERRVREQQRAELRLSGAAAKSYRRRSARAVDATARAVHAMRRSGSGSVRAPTLASAHAQSSTGTVDEVSAFFCVLLLARPRLRLEYDATRGVRVLVFGRRLASFVVDEHQLRVDDLRCIRQLAIGAVTAHRGTDGQRPLHDDDDDALAHVVDVQALEPSSATLDALDCALVDRASLVASACRALMRAARASAPMADTLAAALRHTAAHRRVGEAGFAGACQRLAAAVVSPDQCW